MTLAMIMIVKMKIIITLVLTVMLTTSRFMGVCNGQYVSVHVLSAERDGFLI